MSNLSRILMPIICTVFGSSLVIFHASTDASEVSFSRLNSAEYIVQVNNHERDDKVILNLNQSFDKNWKLYLLSEMGCKNLKEERFYKLFLLTFPGVSKVPEYFHFSNARGFNTWIIDKNFLFNLDNSIITGNKNIPMNNLCFYMGYRYAYWMEVGKIVTLGGLCFFTLGLIIYYRRNRQLGKNFLVL